MRKAAVSVVRHGGTAKAEPTLKAWAPIFSLRYDACCSCPANLFRCGVPPGGRTLKAWPEVYKTALPDRVFIIYEEAQNEAALVSASFLHADQVAEIVL